jgi:hypothetical protein
VKLVLNLTWGSREGGGARGLCLELNSRVHSLSPMSRRF